MSAGPHLDDEALLAYWLGEAPPQATDAADEHLMACDACGEREAFAAGTVSAMVTPAFVERQRQRGLRVREYRVPLNGSVQCCVAPEDDLLVSRIAAPLEGVQRLDAVLRHSLAPGQDVRLSDIPFDAAAGEIVFLPPLAEVRTLPSHDLVVRLLAVDDHGERELGHYTFHHRAHESGA